MQRSDSLPLTERIANWVVDLTFADIPLETSATAKLVILDQVGVAVRGSTLKNVAPMLRMVQGLGARPESTILGSDERTAAPYAAYVNGTFGHSAQFDDSHALAWHIGSCVVPTALAFAEREGSAGADVIVAVVAGAQVMSLLGTVTTEEMQRVGWHGAKVLGVFAAAAAAGKLLGLTPVQLANAFAIAASEASGTMEYDRSGGEVKRLHSGAAARSGAQAALLAQDGLTGPLTVIEGPRGLFQLFAGTVDIAPLEAAWDHFHINDTIFRMYPTVGTIASPLDAIRELSAEHEFDWREIEQIRVGLASYAIGHGATIRRPKDALAAQFSLAFSVGLFLVRGDNSPDDYFDPQVWTDPDVLAVGDLVAPYAMEFEPGTPMLSSRVDIRLTDGREFGVLRKGFRGHPASRASLDDLQAKFSANVDGILDPGAVHQVMVAVAGLEFVPDVGELMALLR